MGYSPITRSHRRIWWLFASRQLSCLCLKFFLWGNGSTKLREFSYFVGVAVWQTSRNPVGVALSSLLLNPPSVNQHSRVLVLAATKCPAVLDAALLRPWSFDLQFTVLTCRAVLISSACTPAARPACPMLSVNRLPVVPMVSLALTRRPTAAAGNTM